MIPTSAWKKSGRLESSLKSYPDIFSSYKYKYMHTCPSELAKLAEEKGRTIAPLE